MIHIGFTGTRHGMTDKQRQYVDAMVAEIIGGDVHAEVVAHHGDCVGADEQFNEIARMYGCFTVGHIPSDDSLRAHCEVRKVMPPLPYMQRNANIVAGSDFMLATPAESSEQSRGGTWATIRMARRSGKPLAIVWPDGTATKEHWS